MNLIQSQFGPIIWMELYSDYSDYYISLEIVSDVTKLDHTKCVMLICVADKRIIPAL